MASCFYLHQVPEAQRTHENNIHRMSAPKNCHSLSLEALCSNTKKDSRNEHTDIQRMSATNLHNCFSCVSHVLLPQARLLQRVKWPSCSL